MPIYTNNPSTPSSQAGNLLQTGNDGRVYLDSGDYSFLHTQSVAATIWTVNHNFGRRPTVTVLSVGGQQIVADVLHISLNQVQVSLDAAMMGYVICV